MAKKNYVTPELFCRVFPSEDVIRTSSGVGFKWDDDWSTAFETMWVDNKTAD